jgi:holo-[acyl-carrier-protein] synthase
LIAGCGIDLVCIDRLNRWQFFADQQLLRIFTHSELAAIRGGSMWSSQRAASYFGLKEAFYKALSCALVSTGRLERQIFFIQTCSLVVVQKNSWGIPELIVDWQGISSIVGFDCSWAVHCSYTHEREYVVAYVILDQK